MSNKQIFLRALAAFLVDDQATKSIQLEMDNDYAKAWAAIRAATPVFGYPTVREAERQLGDWLGIEPAEAV